MSKNITTTELGKGICSLDRGVPETLDIKMFKDGFDGDLRSQMQGLLYRAESSEGVYKPKRVGRRTDRYKRYFGAKTPPLGGYSFISLVFRGHWKACSKHYLIK